MTGQSDLTSHRREAEDEDVAFLLAHGETFERACARVGVQPDAIEKRHRDRVARES